MMENIIYAISKDVYNVYKELSINGLNIDGADVLFWSDIDSLSVNRLMKRIGELKAILADAESRKKGYEQAFASTQIREAKAVTRVRAINSASASVLDRYTFQRTDGSVVEQGSVDAKQIQMLVSEHVQKYRQNIESMLKNEIIKNNESLHRYIDGMESKFTSDFGRNMKYTKQVRDELQRYVDEIDKKGKSGDRVLREELMRYITQLNAAEKSLGAKMTGMRIDVSRIALKK